MINIILDMFVALTFLIAIIMTNKTGTKPNANILLGVTLPYSELKNKQVEVIIKSYRKAYLILGSAFFVLIVPLLFFYLYVSLQLLYLFIWILLLFHVNGQVQRIYWQKLYFLKKEKDWYVGTKHLISVDTAVSRQKNKMPVAKGWFVPAALMSLFPPIYCLSVHLPHITSWILACSSAIMVCICFFAYVIVSKEKTTTYVENSILTLH